MSLWLTAALLFGAFAAVWQPRKAEKSGILTPVLPTGSETETEEEIMGRGILLYLLGSPFRSFFSLFATLDREEFSQILCSELI